MSILPLQRKELSLYFFPQADSFSEPAASHSISLLRQSLPRASIFLPSPWQALKLLALQISMPPLFHNYPPSSRWAFFLPALAIFDPRLFFFFLGFTASLLLKLLSPPLEARSGWFLLSSIKAVTPDSVLTGIGFASVFSDFFFCLFWCAEILRKIIDRKNLNI